MQYDTNFLMDSEDEKEIFTSLVPFKNHNETFGIPGSVEIEVLE